MNGDGEEVWIVGKSDFVGQVGVREILGPFIVWLFNR